MNIKKLTLRVLVIIIIAALMVPTFITRVKNENTNKDVVLALNYNNFSDCLSARDFEKALVKSETVGINTAVIPEESINTLSKRGDVAALSVSELKEKFDSESEEIVAEIEKDDKIYNDSYVLITKRSASKEFLKYWIPKKYTKKEFKSFETSQGATVFVIYKEITSPGVEPIGFREESIVNAKNHNLDIALVMMASGNSTTEYVKSIDELIKKYGIKYLSIKRNPSYETPHANEKEIIKALTKLIEDNSLTLIVTENSDQLSNHKPFGYADYINSADGKVIRCYETGGENEKDKAVTESRYFKMLNSVIDRNARFVTINVITVGKESSLERSDKTLEATKLLVNKLDEFGYNTKSFNTQFDNYAKADRSISALSLILMIVMWLTMIELLWKKPFKKLEIAAMIMIIPSALITMIAPEGIVALYPTLFAVTAPCFCITVMLYCALMLKEKMALIPLVIFTVAVSLATISLCGLVQSALLSGLDYYINTLIFRGIKLSLIVPIVYSAFAMFILCGKKENVLKKIVALINSQIKVSWLIVGALVAVVAAIYLKRSGNVMEISKMEALMRNTITNLMAARPRTKEFLIGWPSIVLFVYYMKKTDWKFMQWIFAVASSILFASGINSFCHVFTSAGVIYMRVINGLIIGAAVSVALIILNAIFVKAVKYIIKAGKKNGILPY